MVNGTEVKERHENARRVEAIDLLRLFAALAVVLFHYGFQGPTAYGYVEVPLPGLAAFAKYGYLGVPMFFVISGFVIAYSAEGRSAADFAIARVARIYPGFLFCMMLTALLLFAFGPPRFHVTAAQFTANLFIFAPALKQPYMDGVYWTIAVELTFYVWVFILIGCGLFRRRIDAIITVWLALSLINECLIGSYAVRKLLITDHSGFLLRG